MQNILTTKNISHKYGDKLVLSNINLELNTDNNTQIVALLGPSGCGKSILLRILAGIEQPTSGEVFIMDKLVSNSTNTMLHPKDRHCSIMFQNTFLLPHLTVLENILLVTDKFKDQESITKHVYPILDQVSLLPNKDTKILHLSGGQQQRVSLVRSIINQPKILFLDEPFSHLDSITRKKVRNELIQYLRKYNIFMFFVTHDTDEALEISDKICVVNQGEIQQFSSNLNIYNKPESLFVAKLLGDVNQINSSDLQKTQSSTLPDVIYFRTEKITLEDQNLNQYSDMRVYFLASINNIKFLGFYYIVELSLQNNPPIIMKILSPDKLLYVNQSYLFSVSKKDFLL